MARLNVSPTRMELTKLKKKLAIARKGHKLMKDKRDELMKQFLEVVKRDKELRFQVEEAVQHAEKNFIIASALSDSLSIEAALASPNKKVGATYTEKNMMGVLVPEFKYTIDSGSDDDFCYGFLDTTGSLDVSVRGLEKVLPMLLELASVEKTCQLLATEIERTRRRVNALEYIMIPQFEETIKYISMKMEENDRGTKTRLIKVKEMVLKNK